MQQRIRLILIGLSMALSAASANAQAAAGGNFRVEQTVVANGGDCSSAAGANCETVNGGAFAVHGTIGQAIAGGRAANAPFAARHGFWTPEFAPTAAHVAVGGRITTADGKGLRSARVTIIELANNNRRSVVTGAFGYYRFAEVAAGQSYLVEVSSKRYNFLPQAVTVKNETTLDFTAEP